VEKENQSDIEKNRDRGKADREFDNE
jgi:hypothetical protein